MLNFAIKDATFGYQFSNFFEKIKLSKSGNNEDLYKRFEDYIKKDEQQRNYALKKFLVPALKYGKNKQLFYTYLGLKNRKLLSNKAYIINKLALRNIKQEPFNHLLKESPQNNDILYMDFKTNPSDTKKMDFIELCIFKEIKAKEKDGEVNEDINEEIEKGLDVLYNFTWVTIDIVNNFFTISVRPQENQMVNYYTSRTLFSELQDFLQNLFSLDLDENMSHTKETLYKIYLEYLTKSEEPYRKKVEEIEAQIDNSQKELINLLNLEGNSTLLNTLQQRYKKLIERVLLLDDFENYNINNLSKGAIIKKFSLSDNTGASAHLLNNHKNGLDISTLYFDVRDTIDEIKRINKLWIDWFKARELPSKQISIFDDETTASSPKIKYNRVNTKLEAHKKFLILSFTDTQCISEEEFSYVFEKIREFDQL